jgi:phage-related protein (TIGR01555 family)
MGKLLEFRRMVGDSLYNLVTGLGTEKDARMSSVYSYVPLDRSQLEMAYRSDWIARKVVDAPAEDATREWREWQASQSQIDKLETAEKQFLMQQKLRRALVLARLYGGSALVMGVGIGRAEEPLDYEDVGEGDLQWVVASRPWSWTPRWT